MKLVVFNASPKKNGNTKQIVKSYISENNFEEIVQYDLVDFDISHCTGCLYCFKTGECIIDDKMHELYDAAEKADVILFSTPIYFNSMTSIGKTFIDRFQRNYARRFIIESCQKIIPEKAGILIATAGSKEKKKEFDGLRYPIDLFFKANGIKGYKEIIIDSVDISKNK